ncbi:MAG: hypothetical protein IPJ08_14405 [Burkholderiales bacterium]|nr:hypothetical protein [Burkholderiales bacterium]
MALLYPANTHLWQAGDLVIHDADAKRADMLMVVIGCNRQGIYRTRYAFPDEQPRAWRHRGWRNTLAPLHDPTRFGIVVPATALTPTPPASTPRPTAARQPAGAPSAKS